MHQPSYILVVDDEVNIVSLVVDLLHDEGYTARAALNGVAALREIEAQRPALILMDMYMPQMSGMMLLEHMQAKGIDNIPIVLMTASPNAAERVTSSHTIDYLAKPFDIDDLLACVSRYAGPPDPNNTAQSPSHPHYS